MCYVYVIKYVVIAAEYKKYIQRIQSANIYDKKIAMKVIYAVAVFLQGIF